MEFSDNQAIYLQIADLFCEKILLRKWITGDRIPSVREMAISIEVNPNTVMRTYNYLQDKSIIFNKRGIGYFISEDGYEKTRELRKQDFINHELPRFFKALNILDLTMDDITSLHKEYNTDESNKKDDKGAL